MTSGALLFLYLGGVGVPHSAEPDWTADPDADSALDALLAQEYPPETPRDLISTRDDAPPYYLLSELLLRPELLLPPPVVIPRLAWEGRVTLLASREKLGKSTLMGQAVAALAQGPRSFLDDDIPAAAASLWLALDEPLGDVVRRFDRYGLQALLVTERVAIRTERPNPNLLTQIITALPAKLVIVDHLTEYCAGLVDDPNSPTQLQPILHTFREIAQLTGAAIVVLHHAAKAGGYRDSTQIGAGVDAIIQMTEDEKDESLRLCKCRGRVAVADFRLAYIGGYYETVEGGPSLTLQIQRVIRSQPGCSTRAVIAQVTGRTELVMTALTDIAASGLIENQGNEHRSAWFTCNGVRS